MSNVRYFRANRSTAPSRVWRTSGSTRVNLSIRANRLTWVEIADVRYFRANRLNGLLENPLYNDTVTGLSAQDHYTSLWMPIFLFEQRHDRKQSFLKISYIQTSHLNWLKPSCSFLCRWKSIDPGPRDPETPGRALIMCRRADERIWIHIRFFKIWLRANSSADRYHCSGQTLK